MLQNILIFWQLVRAFYIIILIDQQNYFSDLYPAKILDLSAKPFFSCIYAVHYKDRKLWISKIFNLMYCHLNKKS